jgi:hypothetical protein
MKLFEIVKLTNKSCQNLGQLLVLTAFILSTTAAAQTEIEQGTHLKIGYLNPFSNVERVRTPSAVVPNDRVEIRPKSHESWTAKILVEDSAGVMVGVRDNLRKWQEIEEYRKNWNLEKTGMYDTPDLAAKKAYINRQLIKYLDKRLSGEVRNAEEGSTLHRVGQVQKALKPNAEAKVSEKIKIKFKARVLQGEAIVRVDNPWVEYRTNINRKGEITMNAAREIKFIGVKTNVDYNVKQGSWVATFDKPINDKLLARVSSSQSDKQMAFEEQTNRTLQFIFRTPF